MANIDAAALRGAIMLTLNTQTFPRSRLRSNRSQNFDRTVAVSVGRCIMLRRTLCGLSKQQLGARMGIGGADVDAYERGDKRISAKLLLEAAKQLRAHPTLFFRGQVIFY